MKNLAYSPSSNRSTEREEAPDKLELSIVMPCLNEARTLGITIDKAMDFLKKCGIRGEVVVSDNGSTDGSTEIAISKGARLVTAETKGYGSALMKGIGAARGRYVIMGDSDDSYDFSDLMPFIEKLRDGFELVMGNRMTGGIQAGAMPFLHRYLGNPVLSGIGRLFFKTPIGDFHCGLRGFRRESILSLGLASPGMEFASEMVVKASLFKLRITEVPTKLYPDGRDRRPHLRTWRDGWRHLRLLLVLNPRWLFIYPGAFLAAIGIMIGAWLLPGARQIGAVVFDVHTLLYAAAAIILGFQSIIFGLLTKAYTMATGIIPEDTRLRRRLFDSRRLEFGAVFGGGLILLGLGGSVFAVVYWNKHSFGPLDYKQVLRLVIPSVLLITIGYLTILSSFFLGVLQLERGKSHS